MHFKQDVIDMASCFDIADYFAQIGLKICIETGLQHAYVVSCKFNGIK